MTVPSITDDLIAEIEEYTQMTQHERGKEQASITFEELRLLVTRLRDSERDAGRYRWLRDRAGVISVNGKEIIWCLADKCKMYDEERLETDAAIDQAIAKERTE